MAPASARNPLSCRGCGRELAADNTTRLCGTCTSNARRHLAEPPALLPGFWDHPPIKQALAERHMGRIIAAYRRHPAHGAAVRQADVARWAGISQVRISRIETGPPIRHMDSLTFWAKLLGIPYHLLWFQMPGHSYPAPAPPRTSAPASTSGTGPYRLLRLDTHLPADQRDMAVVQSLRSADLTMGGGHLYSELTHYLTSDLAPRLFFGEDDPDPALFVVAAGLVEMAGWMAHDAGHDERARRQFTRAREFAKIGPDRQLPVHILASLSHIDLHNGQPKSAIRHAYDAESTLSKAPSSPELKARLFAMQARGLAALGETRQTHAMLDRAADALHASTAYPLSPWVSQFDQGSLATEAARCARQLGELTRAAEHAQHVLELRPPERARARAFAQLTLAAILAQQGHPEQACTIATEVIANTTDMASHVLVRHLNDLAGHLKPYRSSPTVIAFGEHLRETIRARTWIPAMVINQPTARLTAMT
ncbi:helix-turn-helix domain-containing protein [Nocardia africana]|uniref:Predicted ATPase n=1 Tax=Nocardia africana TaxID=134964 RepID=A0A378X1L8_9NOCA|nr:helix-turn-helix transcriptional regulator [Nocardia africana]MCC3318281.1 helix-turn-helix transcriptional regulator [Nocardia africana]SUA47339.1 Predicted ATPase [Nocardia africana]